MLRLNPAAIVPGSDEVRLKEAREMRCRSAKHRRHCERSEAIQDRKEGLDCFTSLAMTRGGIELLHVELSLPASADDPVFQRRSCFISDGTAYWIPACAGMTAVGAETAMALSPADTPNTSYLLTLIRRCEALAIPVEAHLRAPRQPTVNGFAAQFSCSRKRVGNADSQRRDRGYRRGRCPVDCARPAAARSRPDRLARASAS
jgi:hypothetical protein